MMNTASKKVPVDLDDHQNLTAKKKDFSCANPRNHWDS